MSKRLFDFTIAFILLLISAPILLIVAIAIRLDSSGPIVYGSPRVGKDGKLFMLWRFRTADLSKPAHLPLNQRLTRVGRLIREYSLDDLPNLVNVLIGNVGWIGPRPTEPERVNLNDPIWQRILSIRPGLTSPAILALASDYNSSPQHTRDCLEADYVQNRSFLYDMRILWWTFKASVASRGNIKARGKPSKDAEL